jgi:adenylate cyclase
LEVTVLFSDIRGFSTFAEQVPPRQVADVVGRHLAAMAEPVRAHGGMLDKLAGDAVMAVFGAPYPVADHPERAVRCAVAMQRRQADLNAEARALGLPASQIGIGINTGTVIAGLIGGAGRVDYTVIGDAVNVAQRLQAEAKAGEILAAAATMARVAWPAARPAGTRLLKGRQQPVDVYRLQWEERGAQQVSGD